MSRFQVVTLCFLLLSACSSEESDHKTVIKLRLNDPESAVFRNSARSKRDPLVWCGEMNARNRMGGMVGFTRYIVYMPPKGMKVDSAEAAAYSEVYWEADGSDTFKGKWNLLCPP